MNAQGAVRKYGSNVDTDVIIPACYLNTSPHQELARRYMVDIDADFVNRVKPGDIIAVNKDFGCGSSREYVLIAVEVNGISYMITSAFARVFYRSSIDIGLPTLECEEVACEIQAGDKVSVDFGIGVIRDLAMGKTYQAQSFPPFIQNIISEGGLLNSIANP